MARCVRSERKFINLNQFSDFLHYPRNKCLDVCQTIFWFLTVTWNDIFHLYSRTIYKRNMSKVPNCQMSTKRKWWPLKKVIMIWKAIYYCCLYYIDYIDILDDGNITIMVLKWARMNGYWNMSLKERVRKISFINELTEEFKNCFQRRAFQQS